VYRATSTDPKQLEVNSCGNVAKSYNIPNYKEITACSKGDQNACSSPTAEQANARNTFPMSG
jgi:hypothetical protein